MKQIEWVSPYQEVGISAQTGQVFKRGEPQPVSDEVAEKLLTNPNFKVAGDAPAAPVAPDTEGDKTNNDPFKH